MARFTAIRNFIVGTVFLGALVSVGYVTVLVTGGVWGDNVDLTIPFDRVNGLKIGDEARIYGYRVGQVNEIRLVPGERAYPILVVLRIPEDVRKVLPGTTAFTVKSAGPLGGSYIEIRPPWADRDRKVEGVPPGDRPREAGSAGGAAPAVGAAPGAGAETEAVALASPAGPASFLLPRAEAQEEPREQGQGGFRGSAQEELFDQLSNVIEQNRENLRAAIQGIRDAVDAINQREGILGALIADSDMKDRLRLAIENIEGITRTIQEGKGTVGRLVKDPKMAEDIEDIVGRLKAMVTDAQAGKGTVGKLLADETLARKLTDGVAHFEEVVAKVNEGVGTAGQLVNNRESWDRLVFVLRQVQEAVEDFREQAPINTFVNAVFAAF